MNEPEITATAWQPMLEAAYAAARRGSATLPLVLGEALSNAPGALAQIKMRPFAGDRRLIYTYHDYSPWQLTHQGVRGSPAYALDAIVYPAPTSVDAMNQATDQRIAALGLAGTELDQARQARRTLASYVSSGFDRSTLERTFQQVAAWRMAQNLPAQAILLGEFGVHRTPFEDSVAGATARASWLRDMRELAEAYGFAWSCWTYLATGGFALAENETGPGFDAATRGALGSDITMRPDMTPRRYGNIDGLRAIAALGVMVEHMFGDLLRQTPPAAGPMNVAGDLLVQNVSLGRFGVALFFLISGFVVPFSIGGERPLFQFAVSRVFRLYPALWLALAVLATMACLAGEPPRAVTVLANMTMAPALFGQPWLSPIYWTLFIELVFYILIALLFSVGKLRKVGVLSILSLALVVATALPVQLRTHGIASVPVQYLGMHLSFLFLGLLLRLWLVERVPVPHRRAGAGPCASHGGAIGCCLLTGARRQFHHGGADARSHRICARLRRVRCGRQVRSAAFAAALSDRVDQLFDVSVPLARERHGLPLPAADRPDQ